MTNEKASFWVNHRFLMRLTASVRSFQCLPPLSQLLLAVFAKWKISATLVSKSFKQSNKTFCQPKFSSPRLETFLSTERLSWVSLLTCFWIVLTFSFWVISECSLLSIGELRYTHNSISLVLKSFKFWYLVLFLSCLAKNHLLLRKFFGWCYLPQKM